MDNIVKIHYSEKDYVSQINSMCLIDNIFIRSIEEIKQYNGKENG